MGSFSAGYRDHESRKTGSLSMLENKEAFPLGLSERHYLAILSFF